MDMSAIEAILSLRDEVRRNLSNPPAPEPIEGIEVHPKEVGANVIEARVQAMLADLADRALRARDTAEGLLGIRETKADPIMAAIVRDASARLTTTVSSGLGVLETEEGGTVRRMGTDTPADLPPKPPVRRPP